MTWPVVGMTWPQLQVGVPRQPALAWLPCLPQLCAPVRAACAFGGGQGLAQHGLGELFGA